MNANQKVARWLKESKVTQTELERRSGVAQNKISDIVKDKASVTAHQGIPLAEGMGVSLDWLFGDRYDWPPFGPDDRGVVLSPAQEEVLKVAAWISRNDPDPSILETARDRLHGVEAPKAGPVVADNLPTYGSRADGAAPPLKARKAGGR